MSQNLETQITKTKDDVLNKVKDRYSYSKKPEKLYKNEIIQTVGYYENREKTPQALRLTHGLEIEKGVFNFLLAKGSRSADNFKEVENKYAEIKLKTMQTVAENVKSRFSLDSPEINFVSSGTCAAIVELEESSGLKFASINQIKEKYKKLEKIKIRNSGQEREYGLLRFVVADLKDASMSQLKETAKKSPQKKVKKIEMER
ncbi:MAG: hypothetical protein COA82_01200 [Alkaliphilus sp.]|nr:hypothetical protein [Alkaliphilus sp. AH-315-G20]MBN4074405.1 hypothetical protein [bacterium AH-315-E09]PHS36610.1 MAG: hypothetical protein COA82_01200 [Alkaliphilus sp.]